MIETISEFSTPRKCAVCLQAAQYWEYKSNKLGGVDKSSRIPKCEEHKETV